MSEFEAEATQVTVAQPAVPVPELVQSHATERRERPEEVSAILPRLLM